MKVVKISEPMYRAEITFLIGGTVKQMLTYLRKVHKKEFKSFSWSSEFQWGEDADTTDGYQFHVNAPLGNGEVFYVWVSEPSMYLLFHETFHLVGDILHTRGITYGEDSEEGFAYLGGWIFEKIYAKLKKGLVKIKD